MSTPATPVPHTGDATVNTPTTPPLYDNGSILKLTVVEDPRILRADMPAVNRVSSELKNTATIVEDALADEGMEIVQAGIGDCDAGYTHREVGSALNRCCHGETLFIDNDVDHPDAALHLEYGDVRGIPSLLTATKGFLGALLGFEMRDFVTITHGGRAAVFMAIRTFQPFMEQTLREAKVEGTPMIAVPVETWGTYPNIVRQAIGDAGAFFPILCPNGLLDAELLDEACTRNPRIRMLMFCNPVNPSGLTYGSDRMARIARIVAKHKLVVHCDDMYSMFAWKRPHRSLLRAAAALSHSGEVEVGNWVTAHTTMLTGVMKAGGSGSRVNFIVIPAANVRSRYTATQGDLYGPPNMMSQLLQLAFIEGGGNVRVWQQLKERRDSLQSALTTLAAELRGYPVNVDWSPMEGGFYTSIRLRGIKGLQWIDRSSTQRTITTGEELAKFLVERAGIVITPDIAACIEDAEFMRVAYGMMSLAKIKAFGAQLTAAIVKIMAENGKSKTM